ncbi:MAG TPA: MCP four helix bundle domain-containing protein, partial [Candidatus Wallbacteria bacterium]|nr:MCP four helix bundle domain-containing protein [Candidatus Wallbacteria bacterium]
MGNLSIRAKIMGGFVLLAFISAIVGYVGISYLKFLDEQSTALYEKMTVPIGYLAATNEKFLMCRMFLRDLVFKAKTSNEKQTFITKVTEAKEIINTGLKDYEKTFVSQEDKEYHAKIVGLMKEYMIIADQLYVLVNQNKESESVALLYSEKWGGLGAQITELFVQMTALKMSEAKKKANNNTTEANHAVNYMVYTILGAVILAILLGFIFANSIYAVIKFLMVEAKKLTESVQNGKLDIRGDVEGTNFEFRDIVKGINEIMDAFIRPLNVTAEYIDRISKGDIPPKITDKYNGDFNEVKNNFNQCIDTISALVRDTNMLAGAAVEGKLATRADASKHQGDFRKIVDGVNQTLDAVIRPLNVAAEYIDRISKGDIPAKITDNYSGDFNEIKNNLNQCIDGLGGLVESNKVLQRMAVNDYTVNVKGNYNGVFAEVAKAVNQVEERIQHLTSTIVNVSSGELAELETYKQIGNGTGKRSENDHIAPAMIKLMGNLRELINDFNNLSQAAVDGKLSTRADA